MIRALLFAASITTPTPPGNGSLAERV